MVQQQAEVVDLAGARVLAVDAANVAQRVVAPPRLPSLLLVRETLREVAVLGAPCREQLDRRPRDARLGVRLEIGEPRRQLGDRRALVDRRLLCAWLVLAALLVGQIWMGSRTTGGARPYISKSNVRQQPSEAPKERMS